MSDTILTAEQMEYREAVRYELDRWVVACNGTEVPFEYMGERWLYVFNPKQREHGYLNLATDIVQADYR